MRPPRMWTGGGNPHHVHKPTTGSHPASGPLSGSTTGVSASNVEKDSPPTVESFARLAGSAHAAAMSYIDGCPECVLNTEHPVLAGQVDGGWRCKYVCSDCGHSWTTDWRD